MIMHFSRHSYCRSHMLVCDVLVNELLKNPLYLVTALCFTHWDLKVSASVTIDVNLLKRLRQPEVSRECLCLSMTCCLLL